MCPTSRRTKQNRLLRSRRRQGTGPGGRASARKKLEVPLEGLRPAMFEHTAWDLALATQSLAYIDSGLAFTLARVYNVQQNYAELTRGILQALYSHPPGARGSSDPDAFLRAAAVYYGDVVLIEPGLRTGYDQVLPQIHQALGERPGK
jgi:hypothetical protein